jgi:H/ACA ribonucleoprotein complex subunit 4
LDKEYEGILYLHKDVDEKILGNVISENFVGAITQVPPVKSSVARKPRERIVYSFDILDKDEKNVKFRTKVQAGTYIRKLCSDIGKKLGVGGHMKELRRTKVGHFDEKDSHSLDELKNKLENILIPIEKAIPHVKKVYVKKSSVESIYNGVPVRKSDIERMDEGISPGENVGIFFSDKLIALGISRGRSIRIDRIIRK